MQIGRTDAPRKQGATVVGGGRPYADNPGPGPYIMAAGTLEGDKVVNGDGDSLGNIERIMLDVPGGRIAYAVLSFGGMMGMGGKLFAIPWRSLILDADNKCFVLDIPKDRLDKAPGFDKDRWPSMADQRWAAELHQYYGVDPYWEV